LGEGRFEPRQIRIGEEGDNGEVLVLAGLQEGEEIVISAQFLLDSESRLQEAIQKMLKEKELARSGQTPAEPEMESMDMDGTSSDAGQAKPATETMERDHSSM